MQNPDSEALMAMDMANMLRVAETMDKLELHLPFDHTSILREYQTQVPLEFDFHREADMLKLIGRTLQVKTPDVTCPAVIEGLCSKKVGLRAGVARGSIIGCCSSPSTVHSLRSLVVTRYQSLDTSHSIPVTRYQSLEGFAEYIIKELKKEMKHDMYARVGGLSYGSADIGGER